MIAKTAKWAIAQFWYLLQTFFGVYNVMYAGFAGGARGDGTADDTAAVQAAVDAAKVGNGRVYFPPGTYLTSATINVTSFHNARIVGSGYKTTTVQPSAAIAAFTVTTSDNVCFEELAIVKKATGYNTDGIKAVTCKYLTLHRLYIEVTRYGVWNTSTSVIPQLTEVKFQACGTGFLDDDGQSNAARFRNCSWVGCTTGLQIQGAGQGIVNGCNFEGNNIAVEFVRGDAWDFNGLYFEMNTVTDVRIGYQATNQEITPRFRNCRFWQGTLSFDFRRVRRAVISDCYFSGQTTGQLTFSTADSAARVMLENNQGLRLHGSVKVGSTTATSWGKMINPRPTPNLLKNGGFIKWKAGAPERWVVTNGTVAADANYVIPPQAAKITIGVGQTQAILSQELPEPKVGGLEAYNEVHLVAALMNGTAAKVYAQYRNDQGEIAKSAEITAVDGFYLVSVPGSIYTLGGMKPRVEIVVEGAAGQYATVAVAQLTPGTDPVWYYPNQSDRSRILSDTLSITTAGTVVTHNLGHTNYRVAVTPQGNSTMWVTKTANTMTLFSSVDNTMADYVIMVD